MERVVQQHMRNLARSKRSSIASEAPSSQASAPAQHWQTFRLWQGKRHRRAPKPLPDMQQQQQQQQQPPADTAPREYSQVAPSRWRVNPFLLSRLSDAGGKGGSSNVAPKPKSAVAAKLHGGLRWRRRASDNRAELLLPGGAKMPHAN